MTLFLEPTFHWHEKGRAGADHNVSKLLAPPSSSLLLSRLELSDANVYAP